MQQELVLAVLPFRLSIIHVPHKSSMPLLAHTLLKIFLYPPKGESRFFSMTETETEVSIILDEDTLSLFPTCKTFVTPFCAEEEKQEDKSSNRKSAVISGNDTQNIIAQMTGLEAVDTRWRAVQIYDDSAGMSSTKVLTALSKPLAAAGISIFNLSTYESDYVLMPEDRIYDALDIIQKEFNVLADGLDDLKENFPRPETKLTPPSKNERERVHRLTLPSITSLHLIGIQKHLVQQVGAHILKLLLFPPSHKRFLSYTETEDEISIVLDKESLECIPDDIVKHSAEMWQYLKVNDGPLGFTETGIVSSIADTLSHAGVSIFYISTFETDYVLIAEADSEKAVAHLREHKNKFTFD
ncbi:hypothetical protein PROFUN_05972 [Planoprotostelium fungivorum]|uniref:CASTOR ACT domain-containing protein n=1 Tax=Planoprotostelium fungivorum TaxID=1890364 RepID=A0A2P6NP99_9EUKA|nr:hypothetical protein PROFUN_05972 [Planoprotostelium fungivorum]